MVAFQKSISIRLLKMEKRGAPGKRILNKELAKVNLSSVL